MATLIWKYGQSVTVEYTDAEPALKWLYGQSVQTEVSTGDLTVNVNSTVSVTEDILGITSAVICSVYDEVSIEESVTAQIEVVAGGVEISVNDTVAIDEQSLGFLENYCISVYDDVSISESVSLTLSVADRSISVYDVVDAFEYYSIRLDVVAWTRDDAFLGWGSSVSARRTVIPNVDLYWPDWSIGQISAAVWADPLGGYSLWGASAGSRHADADYSGNSFARLYWSGDDSPNVPANTPALWSDWAVNTGLDVLEDFMFHGYSFGSFSVDTYAGGTAYAVETGADKVVQTTANISSTTADRTAHISGVGFATPVNAYQFGGFYNQSSTETVTVTESINLNISKEVSINDTTSVVESVSVALLAGGQIPLEIEVNESCTAADEPVGQVSDVILSLYDSVSLAEDIATLLEIYLSVDDSTAVVDAPSVEVGAMEMSVYDDVSLSEDVASSVSDLGVATQEAIGVTEDSTIVLDDLGVVAWDVPVVEESVEALFSSDVSVYDEVSIDEDLVVAPELVIEIIDNVVLVEAVSGKVGDLNAAVEELVVIGENHYSVSFVSYILVYDAATVVEDVNTTGVMYVSVSDGVTVWDVGLENPGVVLSDLSPYVYENVKAREYANAFWLIASGIAIIDCDMVIALVDCELMVPEAHVNMQLPTLETEGV